jgi:hypothetical protein
MTIDFTDTDNFVETIHNDYDKDPSLLKAILDNDLLLAGTENSVSDYEGKIQEAPLKMLFDLKECRTIFGQATDQGAFVHVWGNKEGTCKRGHVALAKAQEGYYDTVAAQTFVDGRLHTFQSMQEHQSRLQQWSAQRDQHLAESRWRFLLPLKTMGKDGPCPDPEDYRQAYISCRCPQVGRKGDVFFLCSS